LPTGCWQVTFVPSHWSLVQGFPSSVHAVPLDFLVSAGHAAEVPVQFSATSHSPAEERQGIEAGAKPSDGQVALVPVQVSATSHIPAEARQTEPALPTGCWQATFVPSHWSLVQGFPSSVHAVPLDILASAGQAPLVPLQVSATSQVPAAARQTVVFEAKASVGQSREVPLQVSATSQTPFAARQVGPAATGEQVPTLPGRLQEAQAPVQVVLQQMPLTQVRPTAH
jgi:hypothetical protein